MVAVSLVCAIVMATLWVWTRLVVPPPLPPSTVPPIGMVRIILIGAGGHEVSRMTIKESARQTIITKQHGHFACRYYETSQLSERTWRYTEN